MTVNDAVDDVDTYYLTDNEFELIDAYTATTDRVSTNSVAPDDTEKYTGITVFHISGNDAAFNKWTGTKAQPWPDAAFSEMYRFEKDDDAMGMILYHTDSAAKWIDEQKTLASALYGLETAVSMAVTGLTYLMLM